MNCVRRFKLLLLWLSAWLPSQAFAQEVNVQSEEIKAEILRWAHSIAKVDVIVTSSHADLSRKNTRALAIDGVKRFESLVHDDLQLEDDPEGFMRYYDGKSFDVYFPYARRFESARRVVNDGNLEKVRDNFFCESLGWWPTNDPSARLAAVMPWYLDEVIKDERLTVEHVSGSIFLLQIPQLAQMEYDCDQKTIVKRTYFTKLDNHLVANFSISLHDFISINGVLLPQGIHRHASQPELNTIHSLKYLSVNGNLDDRFRVEVAPGTLIVDKDNSKITQSPGGMDWLSRELVTRIDKSLGSRSSSQQSYSTIFWLIAAITCIGTFSIARWKFGNRISACA